MCVCVCARARALAYVYMYMYIYIYIYIYDNVYLSEQLHKISVTVEVQWSLQCTPLVCFIVFHSMKKQYSKKYCSIYSKWGNTSSYYMLTSCSVAPGSIPGQVNVVCVVDDLALGQVSFRKLQFSPVSIIPPVLLFLIHLSPTLCKFSN